MYSVALINTHFWLATLGTFIYIISMWCSGITQGLMWKALNNDGTLKYSFIESIVASQPFYFCRFIGGVIFLSGMILMAYNVYKTLDLKLTFKLGFFYKNKKILEQGLINEK